MLIDFKIFALHNFQKHKQTSINGNALIEHTLSMKDHHWRHFKYILQENMQLFMLQIKIMIHLIFIKYAAHGHVKLPQIFYS